MGRFVYSDTVKTEIEDRALAHVQIVISTKLRRGESFHFTWREDVSMGGGRTSVWLHQAVPIVYKYFGSRRPKINPAWIDALAFTANSAGGLHLVPEPQETAATLPAEVTA